jgi:hypothetical protein
MTVLVLMLVVIKKWVILHDHMLMRILGLLLIVMETLYSMVMVLQVMMVVMFYQLFIL